MDKQAILDVPSYGGVEEPKTHHVIRVLSVTVGVLALGMVAMFAFTTIYITRSSTECSGGATTNEFSLTTSYEVDIPVNRTTVHERVVVNEVQRTEFTINYDPPTGFIKSLAVNDYRKNITGMYATKEKTCVLTRMDQASLNFEESVEKLKASDGGMIDTAVEVDYAIGRRVEAMADIPEQLNPYCNAGNTFYLDQVKAGGRMKRHYVPYFGIPSNVQIYHVYGTVHPICYG